MNQHDNGPKNDAGLDQGLNTEISREALEGVTADAAGIHADNYAVEAASVENVEAPRSAGLTPANPELGDRPLVAPGMSRIVSREDMDYHGSSVGNAGELVKAAPAMDAADTVLFRGNVSTAGTEAGQDRFAAA